MSKTIFYIKFEIFLKKIRDFKYFNNNFYFKIKNFDDFFLLNKE